MSQGFPNQKSDENLPKIEARTRSLEDYAASIEQLLIRLVWIEEQIWELDSRDLTIDDITS